MPRLSILCIAVLAIAGCSRTVQTTSGAQYLSDYSDVAPQLAASVGSDVPIAATTYSAPVYASQSDADLIRQAASVEPILKFPARFGLARIERGRLSAIPEAEAALWDQFAKRYHEYGSFTPVDPIIAEFTSASLPPSQGAKGRGRDVAAKIRLGSARQHLDAVLIYEVATAARTNDTALSFVDLTVMGGVFLPTRDTEAAGVARALLLDVRNGYPYGTASTEVDLSELSNSWGGDSTRWRLEKQAKRDVVAKLIPEVDGMLRDLVGQLSAKRDRNL